MPLLIFDCDGVLVDSELLSNRIGIELLAEYGLTLSLEEHLERFVGRSPEDVQSELRALLGRALPDDYGAVKAQRTLERFAGELEGVAGIAEALAQLQVQKCVASGSPLERVRLSLHRAGLTGHFGEALYCIEQVRHGKPAPDLFLLAAQAQGVPPDQCLVIEDSVSGVQAARSAGMACLGFVGGGHCGPNQAGKLLEAGAGAVFREMRFLPRMLEGWTP